MIGGEGGVWCNGEGSAVLRLRLGAVGKAFVDGRIERDQTIASCMNLIPMAYLLRILYAP